MDDTNYSLALSNDPLYDNFEHLSISSENSVFIQDEPCGPYGQNSSTQGYSYPENLYFAQHTLPEECPFTLGTSLVQGFSERNSSIYHGTPSAQYEQAFKEPEVSDFCHSLINKETYVGETGVTKDPVSQGLTESSTISQREHTILPTTRPPISEYLYRQLIEERNRLNNDKEFMIKFATYKKKLQEYRRNSASSMELSRNSAS